MWSWKFIKPCCNDGCQSTFAVNSTLLPSDVIDFAMLPAQRFWQEKASLLDVMWPQSNQWEHVLLGRNFQLYNKSLCHAGAGKWNDRHSMYIVRVKSWWWHCKWRLVDWIVSFIYYHKLKAIFKTLLRREIILSPHVWFIWRCKNRYWFCGEFFKTISTKCYHEPKTEMTFWRPCN